jgi:hypothetical protein
VHRPGLNNHDHGVGTGRPVNVGSERAADRRCMDLLGMEAGQSGRANANVDCYPEGFMSGAFKYSSHINRDNRSMPISVARCIKDMCTLYIQLVDF